MFTSDKSFSNIYLFVVFLLAIRQNLSFTFFCSIGAKHQTIQNLKSFVVNSLMAFAFAFIALFSTISLTFYSCYSLGSETTRLQLMVPLEF